MCAKSADRNTKRKTNVFKRCHRFTNGRLYFEMQIVESEKKMETRVSEMNVQGESLSYFVHISQSIVLNRFQLEYAVFFESIGEEVIIGLNNCRSICQIHQIHLIWNVTIKVDAT